MLKKIKNNIFIILILTIGIFLAVKNYTPGTFLSGWDTLHPEFNFGVAIKRGIFGVFRAEQGLGAVAGHSHMADLPHVFSLYLLHFIFPLSALRYLYIFSSLILGPIGMYIFLNKYIVKNKIGSFLGSLFYLLNLGTLQQFVIPFEMFTTQYALLPWLFLFANDYLFAKPGSGQYPSKEKSLDKLFLFFTATLFATPTAYAATLWYVYFFVFILYIFSLNVFARSFLTFKKSLILVILILIINSFWILPNIYFVLNHGKEVTGALINQLFSPQAFLYNKEFGNIKDIALLKNFLFDWNVYTGNNNFAPLLLPWITHLSQKPVQLIGFLFATMSFAGVLYAVFRKNKILISFLPVLFLCFFFLINDNPPTAFLYNFLENKIPLFKEAFRFPDDKVLGIFTFVFALYFAQGQQIILKFLNNVSNNKFLKNLKIVYLLIFLSLIFYYALPAFKGNLISPFMRIAIPKDYFEMFDWFKNQEETARVANLPIHSFWGWGYYNWYDSKASFQGADFLQFGIKQPLLNRDFDRWIPFNEQYYREMSYALYSQNPNLLNSVLEKYDIKYVMLDKSVISPQSDQKVLFFDSTQRLLESLNSVHKIKEFGNKITIYRVDKNPFSVYPKTLPNPLSNLTDNQNKIPSNFLKFNQEGVVLDLSKQKSMQSFVFPSFLDTESYITAEILIQRTNDQLEINAYPPLPFNQNKKAIPIFTKATIAKEENILSINQKNNFIIINLENNTPLSIGKAQLNTKENNSIALYSIDSKKEILPDFSALKYSLSYCGNTKNQEIFGIKQGLKKNSFSVFGKNNPICMIIPLKQILGNIAASEFLIGIDFDYKSFIPSKLCLAKIENSVCLDFGSLNNALVFGIKSQGLDKLAMKIVFDITSKTPIESAYENFSINVMTPYFQADFSNDILKKSIEFVNPSKELRSLTIPFTSEKSLSGSLTTRTNTNNTCADNYPAKPPLAKKRIVKDNNDDYIRYTSENGSLCDSFSYQNLSQNQGYFVAVTSRNIKGLPLTLCILNAISKHCDVYANLSSFADFQKDVFLLPPQIKEEKGFDININNLGIKGSPSINELKSVEIIPIPYSYLTQITAKEETNSQTSGEVFVLSKSYEKGWRAYRIENSKLRIVNLLKTAFPFIFGKKLKNHILVNNWANGWNIDSAIKQSNNKTIVVVFLPQYLEYLGFALLIGCLSALALTKVLKRDKI